MKKWVALILGLALALSCFAAFAEEGTENKLPFRFASKEEGLELMLGNTEYYARNNENKLEFIMQKKA